MAEKEISISAPQKAKVVESKPSDLVQEAKAISSPADIVDFLISKSPDEILPWETCTLPSLGQYYDGKIPGGTIQVRPMGLMADKILATSRLTQSGQALDHIYKNHVKFPDPEFNPLDLLVGDRIFLLFYLRGITHGNIYEFSVKCTEEECEKTSSHEYDLNKLAETIRHPVHKKEPIKVNLPFLSQKIGRDVWVEVRFMRGHDLQVMAKRRKFEDQIASKSVRSAKSGPKPVSEIVLNKTIEDNLNLLITSVNGVTDQFKIQEVVKRMSSQDTAIVRRALDEEAPGMDSDILVTCPHCGVEMRMDLPITETFFRPKVPKGVRE